MATARGPVEIISHCDDITKIHGPEYLFRKASLVVKNMVVNGRFLENIPISLQISLKLISKDTHGDFEDACCFIPAIGNRQCEQRDFKTMRGFANYLAVARYFPSGENCKSLTSAW
jgi:hypothetical protein